MLVCSSNIQLIFALVATWLMLSTTRRKKHMLYPFLASITKTVRKYNIYIQQRSATNVLFVESFNEVLQNVYVTFQCRDVQNICFILFPTFVVHFETFVFVTELCCFYMVRMKCSGYLHKAIPQLLCIRV